MVAGSRLWKALVLAQAPAQSAFCRSLIREARSQLVALSKWADREMEPCRFSTAPRCTQAGIYPPHATQFRSARVVVASDGDTSRLNIERGLFIRGAAYCRRGLRLGHCGNSERRRSQRDRDEAVPLRQVICRRRCVEYRLRLPRRAARLR